MELNGDYDERGLAAYVGPRPGDWRQKCNNVGGEGRTDDSVSHSNDASMSSHSSQSQGSQNEEPSRKNIIVNYLPQYLTDLDLYTLFCPFGKIENSIVMMDRKTNYSFGFGFVNFSREYEAANAIRAMNGRRIDNKFLKVSLARPSSQQITNTNVYVRNLKWGITDAELKLMFSPFGEIIQQNVLQDRYTGFPRGVAFVRFARREQAQAAIEAMNGSLPEGNTKLLQVRIADNHAKQRAAYVAGSQGGYYHGWPNF